MSTCRKLRVQGPTYRVFILRLKNVNGICPLNPYYLGSWTLWVGKQFHSNCSGDHNGVLLVDETQCANMLSYFDINSVYASLSLIPKLQTPASENNKTEIPKPKVTIAKS